MSQFLRGPLPSFWLTGALLLGLLFAISWFLPVEDPSGSVSADGPVPAVTRCLSLEFVPEPTELWRRTVIVLHPETLSSQPNEPGMFVAEARNDGDSLSVQGGWTYSVGDSLDVSWEDGPHLRLRVTDESVSGRGRTVSDIRSWWHSMFETEFAVHGTVTPCEATVP